MPRGCREVGTGGVREIWGGRQSHRWWAIGKRVILVTYFITSNHTQGPEQDPPQRIPRHESSSLPHTHTQSNLTFFLLSCLLKPLSPFLTPFPSHSGDPSARHCHMTEFPRPKAGPSPSSLCPGGPEEGPTQHRAEVGLKNFEPLLHPFPHSGQIEREGVQCSQLSLRLQE